MERQPAVDKIKLTKFPVNSSLTPKSCTRSLKGGVSIHKGKIKMTIKGRCLCGRVQYEITGQLFNADNCHCSKCRRQHGAAFATYADFNPGDFKWISGEDLVKVYETLSGAGWCFCSECGSSLAGTAKGEITAIALGTVEGDPGVKPESHIFVGSKAQWYEINDDLPQFDERSPNTRRFMKYSG